MRFATTGIAIAAGAVLSVPVVAPAFDEAPPAAEESSPLVDALILRADREVLHEDPKWLALLHYDRRVAAAPPAQLGTHANLLPRRGWESRSSG